MKILALFAVVVPLLMSSCSTTVVSAESETLVSFSPSERGNRVAIFMSGQSELYRSSDPVVAATRKSIEKGLQGKGWVVVPSRQGADYILGWSDEYKGSKRSGYTVYGDYDDSSFSGTAYENRIYLNQAIMLFYRVDKAGKIIRPAVWSGYATSASGHLRRERLLPAMAGKLMNKEFPKRD